MDSPKIHHSHSAATHVTAHPRTSSSQPLSGPGYVCCSPPPGETGRRPSPTVACARTRQYCVHTHTIPIPTFILPISAARPGMRPLPNNVFHVPQDKLPLVRHHSPTSSDKVGWFACLPARVRCGSCAQSCRRPYSCSPPAAKQAGRNGSGHRRKHAPLYSALGTISTTISI